MNDAAWLVDYIGEHVGNLRRKLGDDPASPRFIETIRGVGYRLRAPGR